jgi:hypothetical protein
VTVPSIQKSEHRGFGIAVAARNLFDRLGLQPAHSLIGHLNTRDEARRKKLDDRLYDAWQPLLRVLQRKWGYADKSIGHLRRSEIWVNEGTSKLLKQVRLDPFGNPGCLCIRLYSDRRSKRNRIFSRLDSARGRAAVPSGKHLIMTSPSSPYKQKYPWFVELRVPWRVLLGRSTRKTMPNVLKRFVLRLMKVADGRAI